MIYEKEFLSSKTRELFIRKVLKKYDITFSSAYRNYYRVRQKLEEQKKIKKRKTNKKNRKVIVKSKTKKVMKKKKYTSRKISKPNSAKMLQIWQLKEKGFDITDDYLIRNLYMSKEEIMWLKRKGEI